MRRLLRMLKWLGLSLSTLLLAATVFCWVRSLGHEEVWTLHPPFERHRDWMRDSTRVEEVPLSRSLRAIHGRLWLVSGTPIIPHFNSGKAYYREEVQPDGAQWEFESKFLPGKWEGIATEEWNWRYGGAGWSRWRLKGNIPGTDQPWPEGFTLALPFWMLAVVFGLWPVLFVALRLLRRKRYAPGLCPACGYDLRATPTRCPECGRVVEHKAEP